MKEPFQFWSKRSTRFLVCFLVFVIWCCLLWSALICLSPLDEDARRLVAISGVICTLGHVACFATAEICRRVDAQGATAYLIGMPGRTGVFLLCAFFGLLNCENEFRRIFALCIICGYFGTFPVIIGLTFPSEKEACRRAVRQRAKKDVCDCVETGRSSE